jgi:MFS family permease
LLCLGPFYYGFNLTYISTISRNTLSNYFGETAATPAMYGILIGITPIGAGVGALIAPVFMNFLSRKNFLLFFNALAIMISGVIQINRLPVLLSCRFMQGFVIGNYMGVTPIYIK